MVKDKQFYRSLFIVALPAAFQGLISMGVNMLDNLMVGALGDVTLASVSLANQATTLFTFLVNGIGGGAAVLISQYWGKKDYDRIRRIFGVILRFAAIVSFIVCGLVFFFPRQTMRIFTNDLGMIAEGAKYVRIVCLSYPLFAMANTMVVMLRWMEIVRIGLLISSISLVCNFCFNYLLIFGHLGFPALGAEGAAIATVIARLFELCIAAYYLFFREQRVRFRLRNFLTWDREMTGDFFRHSLPIIAGDSQWGLVGAAKAMLIGRLGVSMVSANSIADIFLSLARIFTDGLANGACVVIGKSVGEKDYRPLSVQYNPGNPEAGRPVPAHRRFHPLGHLLPRRLLHRHQPWGRRRQIRHEGGHGLRLAHCGALNLFGGICIPVAFVGGIPLHPHRPVL